MRNPPLITPEDEDEDDSDCNDDNPPPLHLVEHQSSAGARRISFLRKSTPSFSNYRATPITKHYEMNHQILRAFQYHYDNRIYAAAYMMGLQFVETALYQIPHHGYYGARRHERERLQSAHDAVRVTQLLQLCCSDNEQKETLTRLAGEAQEQLQRARADQEQRNAQQHQTQLQQSWGCDGLALCRDSLQSVFCPHSDEITTGTTNHRIIVDVDEDTLEKALSMNDITTTTSMEAAVTTTTPTKLGRATNTRNRTNNDCNTNVEKATTTPTIATNRTNKFQTIKYPDLPASPTIASSKSDAARIVATSTWNSTGAIRPVPPYLLLPSSDSFTTTGGVARRRHGGDAANEDVLLEKALYLSGWDVSNEFDATTNDAQEVTNNETSRQHDSARPPRSSPPTIGHSSSSLGLETLAKFYHEDFDALIENARIRLSFVNTYQGRLPSSTNGCTVVAPLLCIHHLLEDQVPDPGLSDGIIKQVIDDETPAILSQLRHELGLSAQAFLIPSDAHDYLIANGQLSQEQFITVVGGNILDDLHMQRFVGALFSAPNKRVAACFFFHEHVVAILKLRRDRTTCWYDLIDGLPLKRTLSRMDPNDPSFLSSLRLTSSEDLLSDAFLPKTARVRCIGEEALVALLRWYACSKFDFTNASYIDQYGWDDNSCDFDPRVFQGFVWGSID
jgi:hypothetical protein